MKSTEEIIHWLLFFLVAGGFLLIVINNPSRFAALVNTSTGAYGSVAGTVKNFAQPTAPIPGA